MPATPKRCADLYRRLNNIYCEHEARGSWNVCRRIDNAMRWLESWAYVQWKVEL